MLVLTGNPFLQSVGGAHQRTRVRHVAAVSQDGPHASSTSTGAGALAPRPRSAREAALAYYSGYNDKRMGDVLDLIAEDVVYEDLIYAEPFRGKAAVAAYFKKIETLVPPDIKFCVEDITGEHGDSRCGVRWHVELEGTEFPFSRGVSFYEVNDRGQIVFARDIVEPTFKPGAAALQGISLVAPLVRRLGPAASPATLARLPLAAGAAWAFYAGYVGYVMLGTSAPGLPVWQTTPETLAAVLHESYNFFYVNIGLAQLGLNPVPCVAEHPVSEALFNFVNAWGLMFLPAMLADPAGRRVPSRLPLWVGTMLLTNVFLIPYMALRLMPDALPTDAARGSSGTSSSSSLGAGSDSGSGASKASSSSGSSSSSSAQEQQQQQQQQEAPSLPWYSAALGAMAAAVGAVSLAWALSARPEFGGLPERWEWFQATLASDRVFWAFAVDACLYSVWQATLLGAAGAAPRYRLVPFAGMAAWLLAGGPKEEEGGGGA